MGLTVDAAGIWLWGDEPILHEDRAVALTIGCGYGHRVGKLIALAYLPVDLAAPGTELEVEVLGTRVPCGVAAMPLYRHAAADVEIRRRYGTG